MSPCIDDVANFTVTVSEIPVGTFNYNGSPYCTFGADPSPTFSGGGVAGTFTSTVGLSIISGTGVVDLSASTPGTYVVTNTIAASGGCPAVVETSSITITGLPIGTFSYAGPYCSDALDPSPTFSGGGVAGTFTSTPGLSIVSGTGVVDLAASISGTYVVANTIASADGCPAVIETANIVVDPLPISGVTFASECENVTGSGQALNVDVTALAASIHATGTVVWYTDNSYATTWVPVSETVDSGEVFYFELSVGACVLQDSIYYNVGENISLNDPMPELCEDIAGGGSAVGIDLTDYNNAVFAGATSYTWMPLNGTVSNTSITDGDIVNIQVTQGTCPTVNIDVHFTVHSLPAVVAASIELCDEGSGQATFDLTDLDAVVNNGATNTSVVWFTDNTLGTQIVLADAYVSGTGSVYAQVENDTTNCTDAVLVNLIVNPLPIANPANLRACDEGGNQATFDLAALDVLVNTGIGDTVVWYEDQALTLLATPFEAYVSGGATVYAQVVDTATGCSDTASVILTVDPLPVVTATAINSCDEGGSQATFDLSAVDNIVNGGTANSVTWFEDSIATMAIGVAAGFVATTDTVYAVVTDGLACADTTPVYLFVDSLPMAADQDFDLCEDVLGSGQTAGVNLTVYDTLIKGATMNTVSWYDDNMVLIGSPASATIADQDSLYVVVDNGVCVDTAKVIFTVGGTIALTDPADVLCEDVFGGGSVANVDLTSYDSAVFGGGTAPVFTWYQDAGLTTLVGNSSDTVVTNGMSVFVSVVDGNCSNSTAVTFTVNAQSEGVYSETICNGDTAIVNGNIYSSSTSLTGFETYVAANGCDSVVSVTVVESPLVAGVLDSTICNGASFVFNGTTYDGVNNSGIETLVAANGCDSVVTVTVIESPLITGVLDSTICNGTSFVFNGTTYDGVNNSGVETFLSSTGCDSLVTVIVTELDLITGILDTSICSGGSFIFNGTTYDASNLTGVENLIATSGCDSVVTVTVSIVSQLLVTAMSDTTFCSNEDIVLSATAGSGVVEWFYDAAGNSSAGVGNPLVLTNPGDGVYTYYVNEVVGDCSSNMDSVDVIVGGVVADISANPPTGAIPLDVSFDGTGSTGNIISYDWNFGNGNASVDSITNNIFDDIGDYTVELIVSDGNCSDTAYVTIAAFGESAILIPNVFTPNGDGENDVFTVSGTNLESVQGEIFNRWGQKMFSWTNIKGYWDGRTLAGSEAPDGTYFYMIKAKGFDGQEYFKKSGFSLVR